MASARFVNLPATRGSGGNKPHVVEWVVRVDLKRRLGSDRSRLPSSRRSERSRGRSCLVSEDGSGVWVVGIWVRSRGGRGSSGTERRRSGVGSAKARLLGRRSPASNVGSTKVKGRGSEGVGVVLGEESSVGLLKRKRGNGNGKRENKKVIVSG